jgi:hypothetical protein
MLEEFVIPKHKGRVGLQEVNLNQGDVAGEHSSSAGSRQHPQHQLQKATQGKP